MRIQCPECNARFRPPDDLEAGVRVKCPDCKERFTWSEEDEVASPRSEATQRKRRQQGGGFPAIPVTIGLGVAVIVGIVVFVLANRSNSKKADPEPATAEAPILRPKSPDMTGPKFPTPTAPKAKTPNTPAEPPPDKWEKDPLMVLHRNPDKFIGQTLVLEARMAVSVMGTKENPKYDIIHIGTGLHVDRLYFTSSPTMLVKLTKANFNVPQHDRTRFTLRVEDRKLENLQVVTILKFEFLTVSGDVFLFVE